MTVHTVLKFRLLLIFQELQKNDLPREPIHDLLERLQLEKDSSTKWIRVLSIQPFQLVYFSDEQIKIMRMVKEKVGTLIGHLDATGNIVTKLPGYCGDGPVYMYALVITHPKIGSRPLAVMEFMLNEHDTDSILSPLEFFKQT